MDELRLKNRAEALAWLKREGFKISRGKIYDDSGAGLLIVGPDGGVAVAELERYARRVRLKRTSLSPNDEMAQLQAEKLSKELSILSHKNQRLEFENQKLRGEWISRVDHEQHAAAAAAVFKHGLLHLAQTRAAELLELGQVAGPLAMADRMQDLFDVLLDEYARRSVFTLRVMQDGSLEVIEDEEDGKTTEEDMG